MSDSLYYGTDRELTFIRQLGTFSEPGQRASRAEALRGYLTGCGRRARWDMIDKGEVIAFAMKELGRAAENELHSMENELPGQRASRPRSLQKGA